MTFNEVKSMDMIGKLIKKNCKCRNKLKQTETQKFSN